MRFKKPHIHQKVKISFMFYSYKYNMSLDIRNEIQDI